MENSIQELVLKLKTMVLKDIIIYYYSLLDTSMFTSDIWILISKRFLFNATSIEDFVIKAFEYNPVECLFKSISQDYKDGITTAFMYEDQIPNIDMLKACILINNSIAVQRVLFKLTDSKNRDDIAIVSMAVQAYKDKYIHIFKLLLSSEIFENEEYSQILKEAIE